MSYHGVPSSSLAHDQASTSANPFSTTPANYHPHPRPVSAPPVTRLDIHAIKQELHDALGEHGLPYWKAVNGYLLGQVGRGELQDMVRGWLKGNKGGSNLADMKPVLQREP
jgi:transcriptional coactivator HFI1/ADA1